MAELSLSPNQIEMPNWRNLSRQFKEVFKGADQNGRQLVDLFKEKTSSATKKLEILSKVASHFIESKSQREKMMEAIFGVQNPQQQDIKQATSDALEEVIQKPTEQQLAKTINALAQRFNLGIGFQTSLTEITDLVLNTVMQSQGGGWGEYAGGSSSSSAHSSHYSPPPPPPFSPPPSPRGPDRWYNKIINSAKKVISSIGKGGKVAFNKGLDATELGHALAEKYGDTPVVKNTRNAVKTVVAIGAVTAVIAGWLTVGPRLAEIIPLPQGTEDTGPSTKEKALTINDQIRSGMTSYWKDVARGSLPESEVNQYFSGMFRTLDRDKKLAVSAAMAQVLTENKITNLAGAEEHFGKVYHGETLRQILLVANVALNEADVSTLEDEFGAGPTPTVRPTGAPAAPTRERTPMVLPQMRKRNEIDRTALKNSTRQYGRNRRG